MPLEISTTNLLELEEHSHAKLRRSFNPAARKLSSTSLLMSSRRSARASAAKRLSYREDSDGDDAAEVTEDEYQQDRASTSADDEPLDKRMHQTTAKRATAQHTPRSATRNDADTTHLQPNMALLQIALLAMAGSQESLALSLLSWSGRLRLGMSPAAS